METTTLSATNSSSTLAPLPDSKPTHGPGSHGNPVVAFIIGLAIILLASILNAAGLNLTKLDHVRLPSGCLHAPVLMALAAFCVM
jgi:magnesium transporter